MTIILVKLITQNRIKLLESDGFVKYPEIRAVYDSMVPPSLRVGFSNLLFKNDKGEIFEINDIESFWAFITLEYPRAKANIDDVPVIVIPVIVDDPDCLTSTNLTIHSNVSCDGCNRKVAGIRYKCAVCNDYDLCQYCERQNIHDPSHVMLRFARPVDNKSKPFLNKLHKLHDENNVSKNRILSAFEKFHTITGNNFIDGDDLSENIETLNSSEESKTVMKKVVDKYNTVREIGNTIHAALMNMAVEENLTMKEEVKPIKTESETYSSLLTSAHNNIITANEFLKTIPGIVLSSDNNQLIDYENEKEVKENLIKVFNNVKVDQNNKEISEIAAREYIAGQNFINRAIALVSGSYKVDSNSCPHSENNTSEKNAILPSFYESNEKTKDCFSIIKEKNNALVCCGPVSVTESCASDSDFGIYGERKITSFEFSTNSNLSKDEDDGESHLSMEIVDHRSETSTSPSINEWKDKTDELDYKKLVKQMEMQRSGVFEETIDDIEPEDSASMIGSRSSSVTIKGTEEVKNSELSFSIISSATNNTVTSSKLSHDIEKVNENYDDKRDEKNVNDEIIDDVSIEYPTEVSDDSKSEGDLMFKSVVSSIETKDSDKSYKSIDKEITTGDITQHFSFEKENDTKEDSKDIESIVSISTIPEEFTSRCPAPYSLIPIKGDKTPVECSPRKLAPYSLTPEKNDIPSPHMIGEPYQLTEDLRKKLPVDRKHDKHFPFIHNDPYIANMVEMAECMGFDNCNGWLLKLAEDAVKYDFNYFDKVLEHINSFKD